MSRLRFSMRLNPSKTEAGDLTEFGDVTFVPMEALADGIGGLDVSLEKPADELSAGSYNYFAEGDVLLAKVTPCFENGKKAIARNLPNRIGFATSEVHVIRPNPKRLNINYLKYLLCSEKFRNAGVRSMTGAGGLRRISDTAVKDFDLPIVDPKEQKKIAAFLDRETAQIERVIEAKERFLQLIDAKAYSIAAGLTDGSIMHEGSTGPSGWFGRAPAHWKVVRARYLFRERTELSADGTEELLTVSHLTGVTSRAEKDVSMFRAETLEGYKLVFAGDLAVNTMWAWMGALGVSATKGCVSPSYAVYRPLGLDYVPQYLDLLVRSAPFVAEVNRRSKGVWASRLRLYPQAFLDIPMPVPPSDEQKKMLVVLERRLERERKLAHLVNRSLLLLREKRTALITAAVSGRLDCSSRASNAGIRSQEGVV